MEFFDPRMYKMYTRKKRNIESRAENASYSTQKPVTTHPEKNPELPRQLEAVAEKEPGHTQLNLKRPLFSSFKRTLTKRNVSDTSTILPIPSEFVRRHVSNEGKSVMQLTDKDGEEFNVNYSPSLPGFGAGWKKVVDKHKLEEGDVVMILLLEPRNFKIFISRTPRNVYADPTIYDVPDSLDGSSEEDEQDDPSDPNTALSQDLHTYQSFQMKACKLFEQPGMNEETMRKYYQLCCYKKKMLHDKIQPHGFNTKLVAGIVTHTVTIVDDLKASNAFTSKETLNRWKVALAAYESLGMNVQFVTKKVTDLMELSSDFEASQYKAGLRLLEMKCVDLGIKRDKLTEAYNNINEEIKVLKSKSEEHKDLCWKQ